MMDSQPINIVYVDDQLDSMLSRYLEEYCSTYPSPALLYSEVGFNKEDTYEDLLSNENIRKSNVLLIDSSLFKEADAGKSKFTGEEFRAILNKLFPYIEVIVISQNTINVTWSVIEKCKNSREYHQAKQYYNKELKPLLKDKCDIIMETRGIIERLEEYGAIDSALLEKMQRAINGTTEYDELKSSDIDRIVQAFQALVTKV